MASIDRLLLQLLNEGHEDLLSLYRVGPDSAAALLIAAGGIVRAERFGPDIALRGHSGSPRSSDRDSPNAAPVLREPSGR